MRWVEHSCLRKACTVPGLYVHHVYQSFQVELAIPISQMSKLRLTKNYTSRGGKNLDLSLSFSDLKVYPPSPWLIGDNPSVIPRT